MKILFFGTAEFAVAALEALLKSKHKVAAVITQPEKEKGRGLKVLPSAVEERAKAKELKVEKFEDVNSQSALKSLKAHNADMFVVVAFGQILSNELLEIPKLYSVNIHPSLLPNYRGAAPIQWAIINGEDTTGVTIAKINEALDSGDIISQKKVFIDEEDNSATLSNRLSHIGAELLMEALDGIEKDTILPIVQDSSRATYAPKLKKENGLIDWHEDAQSIANKVRGLSPWPSAYTYLDGKLLKVLEATVSSTSNDTVSSIIRADKKGILVACGTGSILITKLQLEGKKPLKTDEFLRGKPIKPGKTLE